MTRLQHEATLTPPSPAPAAARRHSRPARHWPCRPGGDLLLRVGAGLHHAAGHDQGGGVLGAHLDLDDLALRHIEEEARGRVRRAGQEHRDVLLLAGKIVGDLHARRLRDQHDRPHAGRGKFDQADAAEARSLPGEQRLEHLLQAAIDRAHRRHPAEQLLAEIDQRAPDQIGGEEAEQRQRDHGDDQPGARQAERQIGFRPVGNRHERPHQAVDPGHEPPGQVKGDRDRAGDDQAGQEIVPEPGHQAAVDVRRRSAGGTGGGRSSRFIRGSRSVEAGIVTCQLRSSSRFLKT